MYVCSKCNHPLFSSRSKFAHSSPWPAFTDTIREDSVTKMMETLTAYKVTEAAISWMHHALYHHCYHYLWSEINTCITGICSVRPWLTWAMMGSFNVQWIFVHPGSVWKVWQRTGPRVCEWWSRGGSVTFLNIQPLAQVCPQQRWAATHVNEALWTSSSFIFISQLHRQKDSFPPNHKTCPSRNNGTLMTIHKTQSAFLFYLFFYFLLPQTIFSPK